MIPFEEVLQAYSEEGSQQKAAKRLGITQTQVSAILTKNGYQIGRGKCPCKCDHAKVLKDYQECHSQRETALRNGISQGQVCRILRGKYLLGIGEMMTNPKALPITEIVARYQAGESCREIAEDSPIGGSRVQKILKDQGVQLRNRVQSSVRGSEFVVLGSPFRFARSSQQERGTSNTEHRTEPEHELRSENMEA